MKKYIYLLVAVTLTFASSVQADILINLDTEASQEARSKYSLSFLIKDGSLNYGVGSIVNFTPHNVFDCSIDPGTGNINYWNTDVLSVTVSGDITDYINIPSTVDTLGRHFLIKSFTLRETYRGYEYSDKPFPKVVIPEPIESFGSWNMKNYSSWNQFPYPADTVVIGSSLRAAISLKGCKVLYLRAGIPYHYGQTENLGQELYPNLPLDGYFTTMRMPDVACEEIHVPKGFKKYYLTDDEEVNKRISEDLPVIKCSEISLRKLIGGVIPYYNKAVDNPNRIYGYDITGDTIAMAVGDNLLLDIVCEPYDATVRYSAKMSSSDEGVATVDSLAMIRAVGVGTTVIKAEALDGSGVTSQIVLKVDTPEALEKPAADRRQDRLSDDRWYDLLGRPVSEPAEGIYIYRGRLEMVRR